VKVEPRSFVEPAFDRRCLVRGEIVEHHMDVHFVGNGCFNLDEELLELERSMSPVAFSKDFTSRGVERSKQVGRPMPNVVVGSPLGLAQGHRQDGLSPLKCLNLRFLINAKYDRIVWWIHVKSYNIAHLFDEQWVLRETKRFRAVRLKSAVSSLLCKRPIDQTGMRPSNTIAKWLRAAGQS